MGLEDWVSGSASDTTVIQTGGSSRQRADIDCSTCDKSDDEGCGTWIIIILLLIILYRLGGC